MLHIGVTVVYDAHQRFEYEGAVMSTEKRFQANWVRANRNYVVTDNGKVIGSFDEVQEAWAHVEALERADAERAEARRRAASEAGVAQAAKMRAARHRLRA